MKEDLGICPICGGVASQLEDQDGCALYCCWQCGANWNAEAKPTGWIPYCMR